MDPGRTPVLPHPRLRPIKSIDTLYTEWSTLGVEMAGSRERGRSVSPVRDTSDASQPLEGFRSEIQSRQNSEEPGSETTKPEPTGSPASESSEGSPTAGCEDSECRQSWASESTLVAEGSPVTDDCEECGQSRSSSSSTLYDATEAPHRSSPKDSPSTANATPVRNNGNNNSPPAKALSPVAPSPAPAMPTFAIDEGLASSWREHNRRQYEHEHLRQLERERLFPNASQHSVVVPPAATSASGSEAGTSRRGGRGGRHRGRGGGWGRGTG
ncbi:hypothetical protein B0H67DRAFT_242531 [Lasiosphaeris hirsuta]|uniref:Uncharacterized protein n=1 Tax=Lasiosphaeris hirsuta TaxID=260670 RepID=A0AA40DXQ8_9PEZI|nr:hypothetical protein B0H67DRAFT_242531 [Lasiosphaeris hirsuta]